MITFLSNISISKDTSPKQISQYKYEKTLAGLSMRLLNSPYSIPIYSLFNDSSQTQFDLNGLATLLKGIDIKEVIRSSHSTNNSNEYDEETLKKEYHDFLLESKMKFPYKINFYSSYYNEALFKQIEKIMINLNHASFLSNSKYEIDSILKESKEILLNKIMIQYHYDGYNKFKNNSYETLEDNIFFTISPYSPLIHSQNDYPNTPFCSFEDYISCLVSPYKKKLKNISPIKGIFGNDNLLYKYFLEEGLIGLQRKVLTYKANDIISLYLICHYIALLVTEYILVFMDEIHEVSLFIHNEINEGNIKESEVYIPISYYNHFTNFIEEDPSLYSNEDSNMQFSMKENIKIDKIDERYKQRFNQLHKAYIKIFKVGVSKLISKANSLFFKKYYGRIPHLYKQYAGRSTVVENTMAGDPGEILSTSAVKYLEHMSEDSTKLFEILLQTGRRLASVNNIDEKINIMNSYCKKFKLDKDSPDSFKSCILNQTRYHIASSILQDNEIYGFTVDGILQNKKFPPANHIVTSLFVRNPHERPREVSVSEIFSSEKSILLFAHPEQILRFNNLYRQSATKIIDTFNPKIASITEKNMTKAAKRFSRQIMMMQTDDTGYMGQEDPKEQKKISSAIDSAVIKAIDMAIAQKRRCLQCAGIAHDMIIRVTDLAKRCVVSMLNVETQVTDIKRNKKTFYNSGNTVQTNKRITKQLERNKQHIENNSNNSLY